MTVVQFATVYEVAAGYSSFVPQVGIVVRIEQRTGMVKCGLGTESHDREHCGTAFLWRTVCHIAEIGIVFHNLVLDVGTLTVDEVEDFVYRRTWQGSLFVTRAVVRLEGYGTILAH